MPERGANSRSPTFQPGSISHCTSHSQWDYWDSRDYTKRHNPTFTRLGINVGLTLVQRRRRWTNATPTLITRHVVPAVNAGLFCETQWRHSVKQDYITPPPPYFILWNAVTSLSETRLYNTPSPILHSVKRSDVTRWKQGYIAPPPPYFILWKAVTSLDKNKVI